MVTDWFPKVNGGRSDHWISAASVIGLVRRARRMVSPYRVLVIASSATTETKRWTRP